MRALILAVGLIAAPAVAADQFDLVCHGEVKHSPDGKWRPIDFRYRIDLVSRRWCDSECNGASDIAEVSDLQITLAANDQKYPGRIYESSWIDRLNGDLHYIYSGGLGSFEERRGKCEVAPFSGFPAVQRKF
ncbi:MAG TPA: hypothetical protein VF503_20600 [Sphingobium sp.]|uniref:hypothetical protein n=1 Tax=Sphingobium sp. TaxID=1912891 RepID=UPI002ED5B87B